MGRNALKIEPPKAVEGGNEDEIHSEDDTTTGASEQYGETIRQKETRRDQLGLGSNGEKSSW